MANANEDDADDMRTLFIDKPRGQSRAWVWLVAGLALVEALALAAYVMRPSTESVVISLGSPQEQCLKRGVARFEAYGQWPITSDDRDARTLINSRCTLDVNSFR